MQKLIVKNVFKSEDKVRNEDLINKKLALIIYKLEIDTCK